MSLIIKLLGGTIGFMQMRRKAQLMWGKAGTVDLSDIGNGYMIATFTDWDDYFFALEGGPWLVASHYLTVQTWKRNFQPWNERINRVAVWVRLPGLPGDYYDRKFFYNLGNQIGKAIKVDEMTLTRARTMFARMCVEVDLNAPLLPSYMVDGNILKIEYEGLHLICFGCGKFRHNAEHCLAKNTQNGQNHEGGKQGERKASNTGESTRSPENKPATSQEHPYGGWMVAQRPRRGRRPAPREDQTSTEIKKGGRKEKKAGTSRFAVLEVEEETGGEEIVQKGNRVPLQEISNEQKGRESNPKKYEPMKKKQNKKLELRANQGKEVQRGILEKESGKSDRNIEATESRIRERSRERSIEKKKEEQVRGSSDSNCSSGTDPVTRQIIRHERDMCKLGQSEERPIGPRIENREHLEDNIVESFLGNLLDRPEAGMDLDTKPPDPEVQLEATELYKEEGLVRQGEEGASKERDTDLSNA
ncbi:nipped-B-like protein B [Neltuma alba]|uniref:nipped-B-like protein B n=1 Tax=Neltuma alba TaxID=207710 RepID=UPI0010A4FA48|nr:nipped-B-like protein B [Prosopis alba]